MQQPPSLNTNGKFYIGETVHTAVLSPAGKKTSKFVTATIKGYNREDNSWNLEVHNASALKVSPIAVHVPHRLLKKVANPADIKMLVQAGIPMEKARNILEICNGNLESALSLISDSGGQGNGLVFPDRQTPPQNPSLRNAKSARGQSSRMPQTRQDTEGSRSVAYPSRSQGGSMNSRTITQSKSLHGYGTQRTNNNIYNYEGLRIKKKYETGEIVKTKIVFGSKVNPRQPVWVSASIRKFNIEDNTWDLEVLEPQKFRVHPVALHVPDVYIRKFESLSSSNNISTPIGGVALQNLDSDSSLPDSQRPPSPIGPPPQQWSSPQQLVQKQRSSPQQLAQKQRSSPAQKQSKIRDEDVARLIAMGYEHGLVMRTLEATEGDVDFALSLLVDSNANNGNNQFTFARQPTNRQALASKDWLNESELSPLQNLVQPKNNEFDYQIIFEGKEFGFEIVAGKNNRNALVSRTYTQFAEDNVIPGSLVIGVGNQYCVGMVLDEIQKLMVTQLRKDKKCTLRFRNKRDRLQEFKRCGNLCVMVVSGNALAHKATHCTVAIKDAILATPQQKKDKNPVWNCTLSWSGLYPARIRKGLLKVWCKKSFTSNRCLGRAVFSFPKRFNKLEQQVLEIRDEKNNVCGLITVKMMIRGRNRAF